MSLARVTFHSAILTGWLGFFAWMIAEFVTGMLSITPGTTSVIIYSSIVGAGIGAALNLLSGITNPQISILMKRVGQGVLIGGIGGLLGGIGGNAIFELLSNPDSPSIVGRVVGWIIVGVACGSVAGITDRSQEKLFNGLLGGGIGGVIGGLVFNGLQSLSGVSSTGGRAAGFVLLGVSIGIAIGLVNLMKRQAWLSVIDGYLPGRDLIITSDITILGKGDHLPLPFFGPSSRTIAVEHASIIRNKSNSSYEIQPLTPSNEVLVNHSRIAGSVILQDHDVIKIGGNIICFRVAAKTGAGEGINGPDGPAPPVTRPKSVLAPPPPKRPDSTGKPSTGTTAAAGRQSDRRTPGQTLPPPPSVKPRRTTTVEPKTVKPPAVKPPLPKTDRPAIDPPARKPAATTAPPPPPPRKK
jgi:hypothetical protein